MRGAADRPGAAGAVAVLRAPGATGLGTAWFVNDFAQYESAMRQGAEQSGWLVHDAFTAEPHDAAFMFPLYVGVGKLAATLHLPASVLEHALEVLARAALVFALWRFCRAFAAGRAAARWAFALTLFASGFELFAAVFSMLRGGGVYTGNWSYETNGFGLLFAAPHVPLAMAATLEIAHDVLRPRRTVSPRWLLKIGLLSAAVALLHPFHLPVLLGADRHGRAGVLAQRARLCQPGRRARGLSRRLADPGADDRDLQSSIRSGRLRTASRTSCPVPGRGNW